MVLSGGRLGVFVVSVVIFLRGEFGKYFPPGNG